MKKAAPGGRKEAWDTAAQTPKAPCQVLTTPDRASDPSKSRKRPQLDYITSSCWLTSTKRRQTSDGTISHTAH